MARETGTVKFFTDVKGFGFILPDNGGAEVFVHKANLLRPLLILNRGQRVSYDLVENGSGKGNGKMAANVQVVP